MDKVIKIKFGRTNPNFSDKTVWYNKMFLCHARCAFYDLCRSKGYVYLNDIYEYLGVEWNPDDENLCFTERHCVKWLRNWVIRKCKDGSWNITLHYRPE